MFYVNLIPGIALIAMIWYALDPEPMHLKELPQGDWLGIALMTVGLSCLVVLEEGQRKDWFTTDWILYATIAAAIAVPLFVVRELTAKRPVINLRLLADRNLGPAAILALALGVGLYGTVYLMPLYLTQVQDYNSLEIGQVVRPTACRAMAYKSVCSPTRTLASGPTWQASSGPLDCASPRLGMFPPRRRPS